MLLETNTRHKLIIHCLRTTKTIIANNCCTSKNHKLKTGLHIENIKMKRKAKTENFVNLFISFLRYSYNDDIRHIQMKRPLSYA